MDFDNDGLDDVISGSYSPGDLFVFRKQTDGTFAKPDTILDKNGKPVNVGAAAACYLADWDADGDLDVICGNIHGEVWLVTNEGTRDKPSYGTKQALKSESGKIMVRGDAGPVVADWDSDGKMDLIVGGGDGAVLFFRNTSDGKTTPELAAPQTLVPVSSMRGMPGENGDSALKHGMRTKPHVVDWNGDGKLDLLVGDFSSQQVKRELSPEAREKQDKAQAQFADLTRRQQELSQAPVGETPEKRQKRQKELREVMRQMMEVSSTAIATQPQRYEQHGYVWLYLRKDSSKTAGAQGGG